jgi:hypothetical protein
MHLGPIPGLASSLPHISIGVSTAMFDGSRRRLASGRDDTSARRYDASMNGLAGLSSMILDTIS